MLKSLLTIRDRALPNGRASAPNPRAYAGATDKLPTKAAASAMVVLAARASTLGARVCCYPVSACHPALWSSNRPASVVFASESVAQVSHHQETILHTLKLG